MNFPISRNHFKKIFRNQYRVILVLMFFAFLIEMLIAVILSTSETRSYIESYFSLMPPAFKQFTGLLGQSFVGSQFIAFGYGHPAILFILVFIPTSIASRYITAEIENRSIEILALRLRPRYRIIITEYLFTIFMIFLIFLAMFIGSMAGKYFTGLSSEVDAILILKIIGVGFLFFSAIAAIVTFTASLFSEKSQSFSWNIGLILFLFVYDALIRLWDQAHFLKPYSLFHWYQPVSIATKNYNYESGIPLLLALIILFISLAIYNFSKRDL